MRSLFANVSKRTHDAMKELKIPYYDRKQSGKFIAPKS
jgi:hypothetical protein